MRELKFRTWNKYRTGMHYFEIDMVIEGDGICSRYDELIFMQYIGNKDKNEQEIYEDDIVIEYGVKRVVEYCNSCCQYELATYIKGIGGTVNNVGYINWSQLEIVGNKHENPELYYNE